MAEIEGEHFQTKEQESRADFDHQVAELFGKVNQLYENRNASSDAKQRYVQRNGELLLLAKQGFEKGFLKAVGMDAADSDEQAKALRKQGYKKITGDVNDSYFWKGPAKRESSYTDDGSGEERWKGPGGGFPRSGNG